MIQIFINESASLFLKHYLIVSCYHCQYYVEDHFQFSDIFYKCVMCIYYFCMLNKLCAILLLCVSHSFTFFLLKTGHFLFDQML